MPRLRAFAMICLLLPAGCQSVGTDLPGLPNFAKVDNDLYRGGQPTEAGIDALRIRGVRTVIDLRDDANPAERGWVESRGMWYLPIPSDPAIVEPEKLRTFLRQLELAPTPAFVHCKEGRDRTGLCVALYRIVAHGWDRDRALHELYAHGYKWPFYPAIARYLHTFNPNLYTPADDRTNAG